MLRRQRQTSCRERLLEVRTARDWIPRDRKRLCCNFLRQAVWPRGVRHGTLTTLRERLIKIGAKVVSHSRYVTFQMAEVAVPRKVFKAILERIERLRMPV